MSIERIQTSQSRNNNVNLRKTPSFQGLNPIVSTMDFIEKGGYAASFIIQDGLGFIAPRVGKGLLRGSELKDENGNPILDENGKQKRELNWAYARKEGIREIITGPSAFIIPMGMLSFINRKFGRGNSVKLNYLDGFKIPFTEYAKNNFDAIKTGNATKEEFYKAVFKNAIEKSINDMPESLKLTPEEIEQTAQNFTNKQIQIENIRTNKSLKKKERNAKIQEIGTVEEAFMELKKKHIGGTVNELSVQISASNGTTKNGSIGELLSAMDNYFDDAVKSTKKAIKDEVNADNIENILKKFTNKKMGSRVFTNMSIFAAVAAFYTQIPKLYNMGLKGNPALKGTATNTPATDDKKAEKNNKNVSFTGMGSILEKTGDKVLNGKHAKSISDIFELNGNIISGTAMTALLYGFCIPPRLQHAQDKYDFGEIFVRDFTAFTTILFGAKALARVFSDGFTKLTGLALNKKDMEGRNVFQKIIDYLNPNDTRHSILSSKQLESKYTKIDEYKDGVNGFVRFIEGSGGNIKKALAKDAKIKDITEKILQHFNGKSYKDATVDEIKEALKAADKEKTALMKKFYELFKGDNGLLRSAKTCNSTFNFLSTIVLVPGFIMWLTHVCEKMTEKRTKQDLADQKPEQHNDKKLQVSSISLPSSQPSMAGFLNNK